jgi:cytoskeleton protein RodZ
MSELRSSDAQDLAPGPSAGQMLRKAREAQGLPLESLAAAIKVNVRKLELLEGDRFDELPDATFTRALAQTVCRTLKLDAAPVLARLPAARGHRIEQVSEGLNAPFRDRSARLDGIDVAPLVRMLWAPVLLLLMALVLYKLPEGSLPTLMSSVNETVQGMRTAMPDLTRPAPPEAAVVAPVAASAPAEPVFPVAPPEPASAPVPVPASTGPLQLHASAESWIEVKDARERVLLSRSLQPGETVTLDGVLPMRVKIGNAAVTEVRLRGELVDIVPMTSENIARLELK